MPYKETKLGFACCQLGMQHVCQLPIALAICNLVTRTRSMYL